MRTFYKCLLLLIVSVSFACASGQTTFVRSYVLPVDATVTSIAPTSDGGMIVTGHANGQGLLYRMDAIGNTVWSKSYSDLGNVDSWGGGPTPQELGFNDVVALDDGYFIVGYSINNWNDDHQRFTMKINDAGEADWMKQSGTYWYDEFNAVASYDQNSVIAVGVRGSIAGPRAWLNKIHVVTGDTLGAQSAYYLDGSTNVTGNYAFVHSTGNGSIVAIGSGMITAFDANLDSLWAIPYGFPGPFDPSGSFVFTDGSGAVLYQNKILGFSSSGELQFAISLEPGYGTAHAMTGDENGIFHLAGVASDGSLWYSGMDALGNILWTKGYPAMPSSAILDMAQLTDERIAILRSSFTENAMELIVTNADEAITLCEVQVATPLWTSITIEPVPGLSIVDPLLTGVEPLFPEATNGYTQNMIGCSQGLMTASGQVYIDTNDNGELDPGELLIPGRMVQLLPNGTATWTGADGYLFVIGETGQYDVVHDSPPYWNLAEGSGGHSIEFTPLDTVFTDLNFGLVPSYDTTVVTASAVSGILRCGLPHHQYVTITNLGTSNPGLLVVHSFDPLLTFVSAQPQPDSSGTGMLYWSIDALDFFTAQQVQIEFIAADFTNTGDTLFTSVQVFDISDGMSPELLSVYGSGQVLTCAYDPNDKQVDPIGEGSAGGIDTDEQELDYTIRFQNTGNDTAFTVVVQDQLSPYLDHYSIEILGHSHELTAMTMTNGGLVEFRFDGIMLPDSTTDQNGSQGFIHYRIQLLPDLPVGTMITNDAGIFFDQNPPVITNTVINTIRDCNVDQPVINIEFFNEGYLGAFSDDIDFWDDSYTYTWYRDGMEIFESNTPSIEVWENGIYTVEVTDQVGCVTTAVPYALIGMAMEEVQGDGIRVRPNPFSDITLIEFDIALDNDALIELLDIQGRIVRSVNGNGSRQLYLERGDLEAGIYLLRVIQGDRGFVARVIAE